MARGGKIGQSGTSSSNPRGSTRRWPARFPLSTVETYQRRQWPERKRVVPVEEVTLESLEPSIVRNVLGCGRAVRPAEQ